MPDSASLAPEPVTVKPPVPPDLKKIVVACAPEPCTAWVSALAVKPVGADGAVVSTLTVVKIEVVLPTLSVPVRVNRYQVPVVRVGEVVPLIVPPPLKLPQLLLASVAVW